MHPCGRPCSQSVVLVEFAYHFCGVHPLPFLMSIPLDKGHHWALFLLYFLRTLLALATLRTPARQLVIFHQSVVSAHSRKAVSLPLGVEG